MDEPDMLAHIPDTEIYDGDDPKFEALPYTKEITDVREVIDLTLCCGQATAVTDFSRLREPGIGRCLTVSGGSAPASEASLTPTVAPQEREGGAVSLRLLARAGFETAGDYTVGCEYGASARGEPPVPIFAGMLCVWQEKNRRLAEKSLAIGQDTYCRS